MTAYGWGVLAVLVAGGSWILAAQMAGLNRVRRSASGRTRLPLQVIHRADITHDLFIVRLRRSRGWLRRLPVFQPGQHLTLLVPAGRVGKIQKRCYSLAAWRPRPREYELCIRREMDGSVSNWLHRHLLLGTGLDALSPSGRFTPERSDDCQLVLIAGGVGITPLRAMLHHAMSRRTASRNVKRLILFHAARYREQLAYFEEFTTLATTDSRFHYHPALTRPDGHWDGLRGRLNAALVLDQIGDPRNTVYYLCGPPSMLTALTEGLSNAGISASRIHQEKFSIAGGTATTRDFTIEIQHGKSFRYRAAHRTLLEALEAEGIDIDSECRAGECGVCRTRLLQGHVRFLARPDLSTDTGDILPCCCVPDSDLRLLTRQHAVDL